MVAGGPIVNIIDQYANTMEKQQLKVDRSRKEYPHDVVTYNTTGQCTFKFGVEQRIDLNEEGL